ncbi:SCO6880 family protein [Arthrobacter sp. 31Y]|uniref:SCO6880 family protein n=1 Tax=Arthrobacter sp. 31Y TaxID=1115632 RepID=UPI0004BAFB47|nr:SCO6880 family protein [Arthrobacter sp. 31Y]
MSVGLFEEEELDWERVRYGRAEKRGIVLGLEAHQLIWFGISVAVGIVFVFVFGFPLGALICLAIVVVGGVLFLPRYAGRSLIQWTKLWQGTRARKTAGHGKYLADVRADAPPMPDLDETQETHAHAGSTESVGAVPGTGAPGYRSTRDPKSGRVVPGKPERFMLPGELAELLGYELEDGTAFVYDPVNRYGILAAQIRTENAFGLESEDEQFNRIDAFSAALTALSAQEGVEFVQMTDQTSVVSGAKIRDYYRAKAATAPAGNASGEPVEHLSAAELNPFASQAYENLVANGKGIQEHESWIVVVLSQKKLDRVTKTAGGGLGGFMDASQNTLGAITTVLADTGASVRKWMNLRELSSVIRRASDPASALEISERTGEFAGVSPASAGPMAMIPSWRELRTDTGIHRTWWVSEWPRKRAPIGFMGRMIFAGDFRHTVTLIARPYPIEKANKEIGTGKADWEAGIAVQEKLGRPVSLNQVLEGRDLSYRETQLAEGYGALRIGAYITVSATEEHELEQNSATIRNAAAQAKLELRCMYGQQAEGFVSATMPLGRGLL